MSALQHSKKRMADAKRDLALQAGVELERVRDGVSALHAEFQRAQDALIRSVFEWVSAERSAGRLPR